MGANFFQEQIRSGKLNHIIDSDCADASRVGVWNSHETDISLKLVALQRFHPLVFVLLGESAERICQLINMGDGESSISALILLRIEKNHRNIVAVEVFVNGVNGNVDDFFVPYSASSDFRSESGGVRARRTAVGAANDPQWACLADVEAIGDHITHRFKDLFTRTERVGIRDILKLSEDTRVAHEDLIGFVSTRKTVVVKHAARAAIAVNTDIAENGGLSSDMAVIDLDDEADGNSGAKATLSRTFAESRAGKFLKKRLLIVCRLNETTRSR